MKRPDLRRAIPILVASAALVGCPSVGEVSAPTPTASDTGQELGTCGRVVQRSQPTSTQQEVDGRALYSTNEGMWIYDIASDEATLIERVSSRTGLRPRLRASTTATYRHRRVEPDESHTWGQDSLWNIDLKTRSSEEILQLPDRVLGFDWDPAGRYLAYELPAQTARRALPAQLCLFDRDSGTTRVVRTLGIPNLTHAGQTDEQTVAWSPRDSEILVVDTGQRPSIFVIDLRGDDIVRPRQGTFARWFPDGKRVLFQQEPKSSFEWGRWFILDITTDKVRRIALPPVAHRPAVSPDGELIAFDDGHSAEPATFVYDVAAGTSQRLVNGYAAPVWLGSKQIAVTSAGPCPPRTECRGWWQGRGEAVGVDVVTGSVRRLALPTTMHEERLFSTIDVYLPS